MLNICKNICNPVYEILTIDLSIWLSSSQYYWKIRLFCIRYKLCYSEPTFRRKPKKHNTPSKITLTSYYKTLQNVHKKPHKKPSMSCKYPTTSGDTATRRHADQWSVTLQFYACSRQQTADRRASIPDSNYAVLGMSPAIGSFQSAGQQCNHALFIILCRPCLILPSILPVMEAGVPMYRG